MDPYTEIQLHPVHRCLFWHGYKPMSMTITGALPYLYQAGFGEELEEEQLCDLVVEYINYYDAISALIMKCDDAY